MIEIPMRFFCALIQAAMFEALSGKDNSIECFFTTTTVKVDG